MRLAAAITAVLVAACVDIPAPAAGDGDGGVGLDANSGPDANSNTFPPGNNEHITGGGGGLIDPGLISDIVLINDPPSGVGVDSGGIYVILNPSGAGPAFSHIPLEDHAIGAVLLANVVGTASIDLLVLAQPAGDTQANLYAYPGDGAGGFGARQDLDVDAIDGTLSAESSFLIYDDLRGELVVGGAGAVEKVEIDSDTFGASTPKNIGLTFPTELRGAFQRLGPSQSGVKDTLVADGEEVCWYDNDFAQQGDCEDHGPIAAFTGDLFARSQSETPIEFCEVGALARDATIDFSLPFSCASSDGTGVFNNLTSEPIATGLGGIDLLVSGRLDGNDRPDLVAFHTTVSPARLVPIIDIDIAETSPLIAFPPDPPGNFVLNFSPVGPPQDLSIAPVVALFGQFVAHPSKGEVLIVDRDGEVRCLQLDDGNDALMDDCQTP